MATNDATGEVTNIQSPAPSTDGDVTGIRPPAPARGNIAEVGTGLARGALADLPTMAGQALQFAGADNAGAAVRGFGEGMGKQSWLTMQPDQHGGVTNFLASGAEQLPTIAGAVGGGMLAAAALPVAVPTAVSAAIGAAGIGALAAGQAGQQTLEAAQAKGLSPEAAQSASRLNAATTFATQVGAGMVGGKVLGAVGDAFGKAVGTEAVPLANQVLGQLTGSGGWLKAGLQAGATGAVENTTLMAAQSSVTAGVNNAYGIDDQDPLAAAVASIPQALALSAVLTPLGLASRALQVRSASARTATLASEKTEPALRQQLADQYAQALPTSEAQLAFIQNAKTAIDHGLPLKVDTGLFDPGAVQAPVAETPVAETPAAATPLLTNNPSPNIVFPDGTVARSHQEVDDYINGLPENEQAAARAKLLGLGAQPVEPAPAAAPLQLPNNPTAPQIDQMIANSNGLVQRAGDSYTFPDGSSTKDVSVVQEFLNAQNAPKTPEQLAQEYTTTRASAVQSMLQAAMRPEPGISAQDMINKITGADNDSLTKSQQAKRRADAKAALGEPSGVRVSAADTGIERELSMGELYDLRNQPTAQPAPENGIVTPPAEPSGNATISPEAAPALAGAAKPVDAIKADIDAVNQANDFSTKQQSMTPFQKKLDALGLEQLATHQEQIDALTNALQDKKLGQGVTRDRMQALLDKWKGETPQEPQEDTLGKALQGTADSLQKQVDTAAAGRQAAADAAFKAQQEADGAQLQASASAPFGGARLAKANTRLEAAQTALAEAQRVHQSQVDSHNALSESLVEAQQQLADHQNRGEIAARAAQKAADIAEQQNNLAAARALPEAPTQADTLPENIPASVETQAPAATNAALPEGNMAPAQTSAPGHDAALPENLTQSPRSHAQDTADMVDASLASFNQRIRDGEKLTPLEQERYEDLQGFRNQLADVVSGKTNSEAFAQSISDIAREAATKPYTESYRNVASSDVYGENPRLVAQVQRSDKLVDTLNHIAQTGATPEARALATRLAAIDSGTTIAQKPLARREGVTGNYDTIDNRVDIYPGGENEHNVLHEAVHAATADRINAAAAIEGSGGKPKTQAEAKLLQGYREIVAIANEAAKAFGSSDPRAWAYGFTSPHEFIAELNSNPEFQKTLKDASLVGKDKPTLWARVVSAVRKLLGMPATAKPDFLERALAVNDRFFRQQGEPVGFPLPEGSLKDLEFRKSPADAAKVTDDQYSKLGGLADKVGEKLNIAALEPAAYRALASWKTVQYLADRIRALPEMVESGFAKGLDAYQQAHESKRIASMFITKPVSAFADGVQKMLNKLPGDQQRELSRQMATIGGEASRGGFDYRMNYADNVKAGRDIPAHNKAYVDDIHRQFTQLQRSNPEAAKAIVDGQLLNHKLLVNTTSTIARNLMEIASGSYTKLAADLTRMAPDDAARAAQESRVQGALPAHEMARAHAGRLDIMDKTLEAARNTKPDTFADGATQALDARLNAMFADARKLPEGSMLRGHMNELEQMYRAQAQNPYFSLGRSGDYFVKASLKGVDELAQQRIQDALKGTNKVVGNLVGNDGNVFFRVNSQEQAEALHKKLVGAAGTAMVKDSNAWGKLAYNDPSFVAGTSPALRQMLASLHSTTENAGLPQQAADAMRETLTRSLLSILPETASRSAKMNRQGVPGYDADFLGNYSRRAMGGVRDTASIYTQRAFDDSLNQMRASVDQLNRTGTAGGRIRATDTLDEITKRYANDHKSVDNTTINTINSLGHAFYLAVSPAYLIRTTAQPFHRALPLLGSRYGFVNSAKEIAGATGVSLKVVANTLAKGWQADGLRGVLDTGMQFKGLGLKPTEEAFVQELHDRGILNLGQTRQLQMMSLGGTQRQQDLQRMASMTAQYAEMTNRLATGLAAFRLAEKGSKNVTQEGHAANVEYAIQAVDRAMDNFDPTNTARAISKNGFAGKVTPLLTAFMNYNLQTMQQIARTVHDGMFNKDQSPAGLQRASEARKEFGGLMATTMMISGAMGLPFANVFAGLYNTFTNDNNDPRDIRIDAQNFLAKTFGHTAGDIIAHGLPRAANFDSSTFGLENLLPGSDFLASRQLLKDRLSDQSMALMGPALNGAVGIAQAMDKISDGYWAKGIEAALPSGLKPYFKAAELAQHGYTDGRGNPLPMAKPTGWDIARQAVGFNSGERATEMEAQQFASARRDRQSYQKGLIADQFYKAAQTGDQDTLGSATSKLQEFNAANPTQPIRSEASAIRTRMAQYMLGMNSGLGFGVQRRELPSLKANLAFARDPDAAMPGE
jgi:hypothetical protein